MAAVATPQARPAPAAAPREGKLRVGVFAARRVQPRWIVDAFLRIAASEFAEVVLVSAADGGRASSPLAWQLYDRSGKPAGEAGRLEGGIPTWSMPATVARADGGFVVIH